ncbi:hypothetical protein L2E82_42542 [Cichorium intybus]|uniref:Uncharacterized protein n=1 Tax=Cichorium intybus TaxID=13427 RepID=A0ACB8ZLQ7_CICIN|nr:hypothetical protein L2E82_42542 [Cichorium intybus]
MLAVLLLVGVMGMMVAQKVRDRRMFNLLIKDKDRQILSLHLLLQKERQYAKEHKKKNQDLNAKLYSLRTQKTDLDNKIMEMRSTIGSMKEEQRALEMAIDEKQNEIKRKESKINDLKTTLHSPSKIWSVSSDDPSNREANLTKKVTTSINPSVQVQNPNFSVEHDDLKVKKGNSTMDVKGSEENGDGLSIKGRRSFIGSSGSEREGNKWREKRSVDEERKYEDEGENASDADQDYKEETED